jgi:hypothetical protein
MVAVSFCVPSTALGEQGKTANTEPGRAASSQRAPESVNVIRSIQRELLPGLDRVTLTLGSDDTLRYETNQLTAPPRVYVDLAQVDVERPLYETPHAYDDGVVRSIRVGRHPDLMTRVVLDLDEMASFTVSTLQDPARLIVEVAHSLPAAPEAGINASRPVGAAEAASGQPVAAREFVELQALGGPNAFCPPSLQPLGDPRNLFEAQADDIRSVIRQGFTTVSAAEVDALITDLFRQVQEFDGAVQDYATGTELEWMAVKRSGEPALVGPVRWVSDAPMPGFEVRARAGDMVHTFVIPTACCNLSSLRSDPVPDPPELTVELCPSCLGSQIVINAAADVATDLVDVSLTGPDGATDSMDGTGAVEWQHTLDEAGEYRVTAVATNEYGDSQGTTRTVEVPRADELARSLDLTLSREEDQVTVVVTAGPELARRLIGETVTPATTRGRIEQLLAEANLEITVTGEGADAAPVSVSNPVATADGIRWERRLGPYEPGRFTVTAAVRNGWGVCETNSSITVPPPPMLCTLSALPPMQLSDGRVRVGVDMCGGEALSGPFTLKLVQTSGESRQVVLNDCRGTVTLDEPGRYSFIPVQAGERRNDCAVPVIVVPRPKGRSFIPMASLFAGPERRWRVHGEPDLTAGLVGGSAGVMFPVAQHLGLFTRVGVAINTRETGYSSLFADVGADVLFGRGFVGGGVGLWDFNNDFSDKSIFFHGGLDTPWRFAGSTVQWFAEGRLFLDMLDMIDNNYLAVTGLRMLWKDDTPAGSANPPGSR